MKNDQFEVNFVFSASAFHSRDSNTATTNSWKTSNYMQITFSRNRWALTLCGSTLRTDWNDKSHARCLLCGWFHFHFVLCAFFFLLFCFRFLCVWRNYCFILSAKIKCTHTHTSAAQNIRTTVALVWSSVIHFAWRTLALACIRLFAKVVCMRHTIHIYLFYSVGKLQTTTACRVLTSHTRTRSDSRASCFVFQPMWSQYRIFILQFNYRIIVRLADLDTDSHTNAIHKSNWNSLKFMWGIWCKISDDPIISVSDIESSIHWHLFGDNCIQSSPISSPGTAGSSPMMSLTTNRNERNNISTQSFNGCNKSSACTEHLAQPHNCLEREVESWHNRGELFTMSLRFILRDVHHFFPAFCSQ